MSAPTPTERDREAARAWLWEQYTGTQDGLAHLLAQARAEERAAILTFIDDRLYSCNECSDAGVMEVEMWIQARGRAHDLHGIVHSGPLHHHLDDNLGWGGRMSTVLFIVGVLLFFAVMPLIVLGMGWRTNKVMEWFERRRWGH